MYNVKFRLLKNQYTPEPGGWKLKLLPQSHKKKIYKESLLKILFITLWIIECVCVC